METVFDRDLMETSVQREFTELLKKACPGLTEIVANKMLL